MNERSRDRQLVNHLQIRRLGPEWQAGWDQCVDRSSQGSVYHLAVWEQIFRASCGSGTHYLLAERASEVVALLPLVSVRSRIFGSFLVSLPWTSYGGLCGTDATARQALLEEAAAIARREGAGHIELHSAHSDCGSLAFKQTKMSMRLELPSDPDVLWGKLGAKLRSQVKRPSKEGLTVRFGGEDELASFYAVFSRNMRDLGTPVFPRKFFADVLSGLDGAACICVIYAADRPVAAGFLLGFKDRLEIPWASSVREWNRVGAYMLLYWNALRYGCERGFRSFDFGRSTPEGPHYRFKQQWGAQPVPLYWHYWQRAAGPLPEINPDNRKYRLAIQMWRRLPVALTRVIGPAIARSLP